MKSEQIEVGKFYLVWVPGNVGKIIARCTSKTKKESGVRSVVKFWRDPLVPGAKTAGFGITTTSDRVVEQVAKP